MRLELQALAAAADDEGREAARRPGRDRPRDRQVLDRSGATRENFDLITYYAGKIAAGITLPKSAERGRARRAPGTRHSIGSPRTRVCRSPIGWPRSTRASSSRELDAGKAPLPEPLLAAAPARRVARADRDTTDVYARQAVISGAAEVLAEAGLLDESDALLTAELTRSHSPYYFMLGLAANAKKRGDNAAALDWHAKAWTAATARPRACSGVRATSMRWSQLAPQDSARIEHVAARVIGELDARAGHVLRPQPAGAGAHRQAARRLEQGRRHNEALQRLAAQMGSVCAKLPAGDPARATCGAVLRSRAPTAA